MAVLIVCIFTASGSQIPNLCISTNWPVSPSIPHVKWSGCWWCFARKVVNCFTTFPPQFWINVRGIISKARLTALYGYFSTLLKNSSLLWPSLLLLASNALQRTWMISIHHRREFYLDKAISTAPPPGVKRGSSMTFRVTCIASLKFRSNSFKTSLFAPRRMMVQALGFRHRSKNA